MRFERYAIYWAPAPGGALAAFGRVWLGGDPESGDLHSERESLGLDPDLVERATQAPRRYGLHATLKAPFRLDPRSTETELAEALGAFCARRRRVVGGPLRLHRFSRYLALIPSVPRTEIEWLADQCVTWFDGFRAPLSEAERARRPADMPEPQRSYFEEFGYPDIFSRFFFHITLAGPLSDSELDMVEAALMPAVAALTEDDFAIEDICLVGDPGAGRLFRILRRCPLIR